MHLSHEAPNICANSKILIIEDNLEDFEFTTRALLQAGFEGEWHHVQDGQQAIDYLQYLDAQHEKDSSCEFPSLIFLDLNMPRISGVKILETIKEHSRFKKIPVLILSTSNQKRHVDECYSKGANSYIHKSLNYSDLKASMESVIRYWFSSAILPDPAFDYKEEFEQQSFYLQPEIN